MLRTVKAKNARSKRALQKREAKVFENPKKTLFLRGNACSESMRDIMGDFHLLKKPHVVQFTKKNEVRPFDDLTSLEFFSNKNDASFTVLGSHNKKRPDNITFLRFFNFQVLDMFEFGVSNFVSIRDFGTAPPPGYRPLLVFSGERFETDPYYKAVRNYFIDFFRPEDMEQINLEGIQHVISFTADPNTGVLYMRGYRITLLKATDGSKGPYTELQPMGPMMDLTPRRHRLPEISTLKEALRVPREAVTKKVKNIEHNTVGDRLGRVHLGRQEVDKMATRKFKAFRKGNTPEPEADADME